MKAALLFLTAIFFFGMALGQKKRSDHYRIQIDSLEQIHDSTLYKILSFKNDIITNETTGFIFPDSIMVPRYHLFGNPRYPLWGKRKVYCKRVLKHGREIEYLSDGNKKISNYFYDKLLAEWYADANNNEIEAPHINVGPCAIVGKTIIIEGTKKKK